MLPATSCSTHNAWSTSVVASGKGPLRAEAPSRGISTVLHPPSVNEAVAAWIRKRNCSSTTRAIIRIGGRSPSVTRDSQSSGTTTPSTRSAGAPEDRGTNGSLGSGEEPGAFPSDPYVGTGGESGPVGIRHVEGVCVGDGEGAEPGGQPHQQRKPSVRDRVAPQVPPGERRRQPAETGHDPSDPPQDPGEEAQQQQGTTEQKERRGGNREGI